MTATWTATTNKNVGDPVSSSDRNTYMGVNGNLDFLNALVPIGSIMMWSGTLATIPTNWHLCDGTNGTPNLLAKFVEGVANGSTNPGATGGSVGKNTAGHQHGIPYLANSVSGSTNGIYSASLTNSSTDTISDIRQPYYDLAFIMRIS